MPRSNPLKLLVEGDDEKRVIPYFMDEHAVWGDRKEEWAVRIEQFDGVEKFLKPGVIEAELKESGLQAVGLIVDADDSFDSRWARIRERCRNISDAFPEDLPPDGLIYVTPDGLRIGVWIMPDNHSRGMLETFLGYLMTPDRLTLWEFACKCCEESNSYGSPRTDSHRDKANIHTYLAWLDPPGRQMHVAVLARALDARSPLCNRFVSWFMNLFQLSPRATPL